MKSGSKSMVKRTKTSRTVRRLNEAWSRNRTYRVTLTSMSDPSALIDTEVCVKTLKHLMVDVVELIARLNRRRVSDHFSVTLVRQADNPGIVTECIAIMEASPLPDTEPRITNLVPIDMELTL